MMGYNISLAMSVNILTRERIQTVFEIDRNEIMHRKLKEQTKCTNKPQMDANVDSRTRMKQIERELNFKARIELIKCT